MPVAKIIFMLQRENIMPACPAKLRSGAKERSRVARMIFIGPMIAKKMQESVEKSHWRSTIVPGQRNAVLCIYPYYFPSSSMRKVAYILLLICNTGLLLFLGLYFFSGSAELFPTDEQQGKVKIISGGLFLLFLVVEWIVIARRRKK